MKEYKIEDGKEINVDDLKEDGLPKEFYPEAHKGLPIVCHDVFIEYNGGILFVIRDNVPAKGELWCIGGRVKKGFGMLDSLKDKTRQECGLEINDIKFLGNARTFWKTDPFRHGKGTDTINFVFYAKGTGELKLDDLHKEPQIITPEKYKIARDKLHPYMRDFMDKIINENSHN
jgi:ADP-ribose pyrophosphatase YjhB (NUDIX family)